MKREVIATMDGSKTIRIIDLNENYHSSHGALQEAQHVFIKNGLHEFSNLSEISIFEVGFGTGLNAFLTAIEAYKLELKVNYFGIEAFPVSENEIQELEYNNLLGEDYIDLYSRIHQSVWESDIQLSENFNLTKIEDKLQSIKLLPNSFDIIYYDAFGPRAQEEMWSLELFQKMYDALKDGGFLVTYCAKGQVKRDLKTAGFEIEALPGPPGKREMTRAWKR